MATFYVCGGISGTSNFFLSHHVPDARATLAGPPDDAEGKVHPHVDATQPHRDGRREKEMTPPGQQVIHFLTIRGCVNAHNNYVKKKSQPFDYEYESSGLTLQLHSQEAEG
jgi:hypothetical protein